MKWERGHTSPHVEDRRGGGKLVKAGGVGGVLVTLVMALVFGPQVLIDRLADPKSDAPRAEIPGEQVEFISFALDDIQATWDRKFAERDLRYRPARLVLFTDAVHSACGRNSSAVGPFYCPADRKAYIDLSFFEELRLQFGAPGDFAQAYVLAHEIGHHIQNITGVFDGDRRYRPSNQTSIRRELQADCLAGVWAHSSGRRGLLEAGDIKEALNAAAAIGDDTLQRRSVGRVQPENWTHGSSEQRVEWFMRGYENGDMSDCNTSEVALRH